MDWTKQRITFPELANKLRNKAGRGADGKITVRHRGGGKKRIYRNVDRQRSLWNTPGIVLSMERGMNSAFIAGIAYSIGIISYITAPYGLRIGDIVTASWQADWRQVGNAMPLINIPLNIKIHNIESFPGSGAVYARSAGTWALIAEASAAGVVVVFRSGTRKKLSPYCLATIGRVSNINYRNITFYKAGQTRLNGVRPSVRGVAMNAVDHPHGGGKGKKSKNSLPQSPWGRLGRGQKTVIRSHKNS